MRDLLSRTVVRVLGYFGQRVNAVARLCLSVGTWDAVGGAEQDTANQWPMATVWAPYGPMKRLEACQRPVGLT